MTWTTWSAGWSSNREGEYSQYGFNQFSIWPINAHIRTASDRWRTPASGSLSESLFHDPALKELDQSISSLSVEKARRLLDGDSTALSSLKEDLHQLIQRKKSLLEDHGLSEDYLELSYTCPDCKDTGYIGTEKCHCFKKAITDLLYLQSNLQEILDKENFSTFSLDYYSSNHIDPVTGRLHWKRYRLP